MAQPLEPRVRAHQLPLLVTLGRAVYFAFLGLHNKDGYGMGKLILLQYIRGTRQICQLLFLRPLACIKGNEQ